MCRRWMSAPVRPPLGRLTSSGHAPAVRTSRYHLYLGCGGAGPVAAGPRGVLFNDIAPWCCIQHLGREGVKEIRSKKIAHISVPRLQYCSPLVLSAQMTDHRCMMMICMRTALAASHSQLFQDPMWCKHVRLREHISRVGCRPCSMATRVALV